MKKREEKKSLTPRKMRSDIAKLNNRDKRGDGEGKRRIGFDFSYLLSALLTVGVALASVGLVLYFGYHLVDAFTSDVTTTPAYDITESEYRYGMGYIFRSEENITTDIPGTPDYKMNDGERVGVNELLCDIYSSITDEIRLEIEIIDREIEILEAVIDTGVIETGIPEALRNANKAYSDIMLHISRGEYAEADMLTDSFRIALNRIKYLEGDMDDLAMKISSLLAERSGLIAEYGKKTGSINADTVGYFFHDSDGYEDIFEPSLLGDITVGGFAELITREPADSSSCVGKMIDDPKWYVCVPLSSSDAKGFTEGRKYTLVFNDNGGRELTMTLERLVLDFEDYDGDGDRAEALLIFSTKEMPKDFKYLRAQNVSIELCSHKGYRIPITAVRYYDGMTGVYTLSGGYVLFRRIEILYEGSGYCIAADYADAEPGKPLTYTVLGFSDHGAVNDYASLHALAEERGWERKEYDNGGIPVVKGQTLRYFYHLDDLEQIILTGKDLYHGKALN